MDEEQYDTAAAALDADLLRLAPDIQWRVLRSLDFLMLDDPNVADYFPRGMILVVAREDEYQVTTPVSAVAASDAEFRAEYVPRLIAEAQRLLETRQ